MIDTEKDLTKEKPTPDESSLMITPSDIVEWAFCPRFIYYMHTQQIPQHEELRYKVLLGRQEHEKRQKQNRNYLRKKIDCTNKEIEIYLASEKLRVKGQVDEVLHFADGTISPLDYKMTEFREHTFKTHQYQLIIYAMLIREIYKQPVKRGYLVYTLSNSQVKEIEFSEADFLQVTKIINEIISIIERGYFPNGTKNKNKCEDCCYKNICIK